MKTSTEGFQQCYNAQMVVDETHQIIHVEAQASDQGQMLPLLDEVSETFEAEPEVVLADAGYCNEADLVALEQARHRWPCGARAEGKAQAAVDPQIRPATHRMGEKLATSQCEGPGSIRQAQVDIRGTERLDQGGVGVQAVQSARGGEGTKRVASGVFGAEHQADEGAGGVLSEPRTLRPFGRGMGRDGAHTNRQPLSLRVAGADPAMFSRLSRSSVPSGRILSRPASTIRRHDFCGAGS